MTKKCSFCGNINFNNKTIQYIYKQNGRFLLVNNVPCEECEYCGEQYFEASVLKKIEKDFDELYFSRKTAMQQLTVPVEDYIDI